MNLEGHWVPVGAWVAGEVVPIAELRVARLVFAAGAWRIEDKTRTPVDRGDYVLDATACPKSLDLIGRDGPNAGRTFRAIVEVDGDLMTLCYDLDGGERPISTEPQEDVLLLTITYARESARLAS
ncbi:MAG: TIGR03067 domain-containing protein [Steroidobacteraceae bacterium]|nr:TIGR03067 domain-containing protein [Steroidobacteraceae bacterium]